MMKKLFPPTQIDQILEKIAKKNPSKGIDDLIRSLDQPKNLKENDFNFNLLETDRIFHIDQIKWVKGTHFGP